MAVFFRDREADAAKARAYLVDEIVARVVQDARVLDVMREVPRHRFVPEHSVELAYADHPLSIGWDVTISQPSLVGMMSEALELTGTERVLEIGTGSGYQAAVLCKLAARVDSVEVIPELAQRARTILAEIGCHNVHVHDGDGWLGWPAGAPYDRAVVTAAPETLPRAIVDQLADGGFVIVPVGSQEQDQRLERWLKKDGMLTKQDLGAVRFVPMVHVA
ncbi:MAG: protein-L-isoaspartate(D-aspartate) O-methyltransferase [Labilithrix sp.]|nr:protein-L-isoaspartate(D-aspartate) O-methyltransferase [Labilithrix sp.]MCW5816121.1 protein-L-isoaspartate(D-aspartate) O-methyltransferase [Labilithrix sp.]